MNNVVEINDVQHILWYLYRSNIDISKEKNVFNEKILSYNFI